MANVHMVDLDQLEFIDPVLRQVLSEKRKEFGAGVLTSLVRWNDSGVHGTFQKTSKLRGIDESCKNHWLGAFIMGWVNERWEYDPKRPGKKVCLYHKGHNGIYHLHYQVHPNTKRRDP